jgi:hypothetical protein
LNAAPLVDKAAAGFAEYEYPRWSTILGWFIFVICILPVPLFFVISYIQQYRRLAAQRWVCNLISFLVGFIQSYLKGQRQLVQQQWHEADE